MRILLNLPTHLTLGELEKQLFSNDFRLSLAWKFDPCLTPILLVLSKRRMILFSSFGWKTVSPKETRIIMMLI